LALRRVEIELHARAGELAGARTAALELAPEATCADLKAALARTHPALGGLLRACAVATESEYLAEAAPLGNGARFHLVPPVSGG
jgi:molybdopterin converting factor small subunit